MRITIESQKKGIRTTMLMVIVLVAAGFLLPGCASGNADTQLDQDAFNECSRVMRRVIRAFEKKDVKQLRQYYSSDTRFLLPNGRILGRDEVLTLLEEGKYEIIDQEIRNLEFRRFGDTVFSTALVRLDATVDGAKIKGEFWGGASFSRIEGKWVIVDEYLGVPASKD
ncbi:MAG: nuclear transport factor 2 family protein, partial [Pyrinomonadaceae bacterium]|nr:nuclear transport factor 2 family protein [Pyrinomonadaceae bacterium]